MLRDDGRIRMPRAGEELPAIVAIGRRNDLLDDFYHRILTRTWAAHFALACGVFLGANAVFALLYLIEPGSIANARPGSFEDAFYFSVQTMGTIGYGGMIPTTRFANLLVTVEALFGTLLVAVLTGVTFAKLARPTAKVLFADKLPITPRDGVPHLMMRMANWRHNNVVEAQLRVFTLRLERTAEGETIRVPVELPLVRDRTAVFWMSWTAMHKIDASSPLHGDGLRRLRDEGGEIFLVLSGLDETFSTTIHARRRYSAADIVPNARYADILSVRSDGARVIDYRRFHEVEPASPR